MAQDAQDGMELSWELKTTKIMTRVLHQPIQPPATTCSVSTQTYQLTSIGSKPTLTTKDAKEVREIINQRQRVWGSGYEDFFFLQHKIQQQLNKVPQKLLVGTHFYELPDLRKIKTYTNPT